MDRESRMGGMERQESGRSMQRDREDSRMGGMDDGTVSSRSGSGSGMSGQQPVESWKRAAQVTNQLKAKIEQMKVCLF